MLLGGPIVAAQEFPDLEDHWSKPYVLPLVAKNLINGFPDGNFHPERTISRVEWVAMLVSALAGPLPSDVLNAVEPRFADVPTQHWGRKFVESAWELGWIDGARGSMFNPDQAISRRDARDMLQKALGEPLSGAIGGEDLMSSQAPLTRALAAQMLLLALDHRGALYDLAGYIIQAPGTQGPATIVVKTYGGQVYPLSIASTAQVFINGQDSAIEKLGALDEVRIILENGRVKWIQAWFSAQQGIILRAIGADRRIHIQTLDGDRHTYPLEPDLHVFRNGREARLGEIRPGDRVYLRLSHQGRVRGISAVRPDIVGVVWGRHPLPSGGMRVRIGPRYSRARWYVMPAHASLHIDGKEAPWPRLRTGDPVVGVLDQQGNVVYLEVYREKAS